MCPEVVGAREPSGVGSFCPSGAVRAWTTVPIRLLELGEPSGVKSLCPSGFRSMCPKVVGAFGSLDPCAHQGSSELGLLYPKDCFSGSRHESHPLCLSGTVGV